MLNVLYHRADVVVKLTFNMQCTTRVSLFYISAVITTVVVSIAFLSPLGGVAIAEAAVSQTPYPVQLYIPSIKLNSAIKPVGINEKGEMDVPSGKTKDVGWYKHGTVPGKVWSAVLDAHVYAAFKNLHQVKPGSDIYVVMSDKKVLHYVVALIFFLATLITLIVTTVTISVIQKCFFTWSPGRQVRAFQKIERPRP